MTFYIDVTEPFLLEEAKLYFLDNKIGVLPFDAANSLGIDDLCDTVKNGRNYLALPKSDKLNIPIPYGPVHHDEYILDNTTIEKLVELHVSQFFLERKFLVSGRPDNFFAIEFSDFKYDILREVQYGNLTTPMILFDSSKLRCIFFEYDLEINTYSRDVSLSGEKLGGLPDDYWVRYFNENFLSSISYNKHHIGLINDYYRPVIRGLKA